MKNCHSFLIIILIGASLLCSFQTFGKKLKSNSAKAEKVQFIDNNFQKEHLQYLLIDASDTVVFDFSQALCTSGMIQVPVFILCDEPVYALDFEMKFNPSEFTYNSFVNHQSYLNTAANFQIADSTLRFSVFSMVPVDNNTPLLSIRFNVPTGMINISSFSLIRTWLNGDLCSYKSINFPPAIPIIPSGITNIPAGDSLLLSISTPAGYTNLWSNGSTAPFIYVNSTGTYSVAVTNNLGCTSTSYITVTVVSPLPVELLFFDGVVHDNNIKIIWSTGTEVNNDFFVIQRSANGYEWSTIAQVDGNGTTSNVSNYQIFDESPINGSNYYRLKQVDFDGNYQYSKLIALNFEKNKVNKNNLKIYPNPSGQGTQEIIISINEILNAGTIKIYDMNDREVASYPVLENSHHQQGNDTVQLNLSTNFSTGMYIIKYIEDDQIEMCKWIIY